MAVRRTAAVKLAVFDTQHDALHRTAEQYRYCANRTADYCWSDTSHAEMQDQQTEGSRRTLLRDLREETELQAQLVQAAIVAPSKPSKALSNGGRKASASLVRRHR